MAMLPPCPALPFLETEKDLRDTGLDAFSASIVRNSPSTLPPANSEILPPFLALPRLEYENEEILCVSKLTINARFLPAVSVTAPPLPELPELIDNEYEFKLSDVRFLPAVSVTAPPLPELPELLDNEYESKLPDVRFLPAVSVTAPPLPELPADEDEDEPEALSMFLPAVSVTAPPLPELPDNENKNESE